MILNQLPSFFGGGGQTKRVDGFFAVAHAADMFQSRQHFRGAFRQRRQGLWLPFHTVSLTDGLRRFTLCFDDRAGRAQISF
jgi:hypothetical protein